jgi:hypothetical protein
MRIAPLIGARAGGVVFQPNVTLAHAVVFSAAEVQRREAWRAFTASRSTAT